MGLTVTSKSVRSPATNANSYSFDAFTPSTNTPILIVGVNTNGTNPIASISDDQGNTWVSIHAENSTADSIHVWYTEAPAVASTIITVSFVGGTGFLGEVFEVPYGTFGQVNASAGASTTTPAVTMSGAFSTSNAGVCFLFNGQTPGAMTAPADWTESNDVGHLSPSRGMETAFRNSGETGSTITWGSNSADRWRAIVVEIVDNSPAGAAIRYFRTLLGVGR